MLELVVLNLWCFEALCQNNDMQNAELAGMRSNNRFILSVGHFCSFAYSCTERKRLEISLHICNDACILENIHVRFASIGFELQCDFWK